MYTYKVRLKVELNDRVYLLMAASRGRIMWQVPGFDPSNLPQVLINFKLFIGEGELVGAVSGLPRKSVILFPI